MNNNLKILALGDSYTIGESVNENESFPVLLSNELRKAGYKIDTPLIIAKTGWTTDELMNGINEKEPQGRFDIVTLLIGVNNQYRGRDTSNYRDEFKNLLNRAIAFTYGPKNVIVISIPDWSLTPFAENSNRDVFKITVEINSFNKINKEETLAAGANYINITDISRSAKEDKSLLAEDGLHPSGKMYSIWTERILPAAKEISVNKNSEK